MNEEEELKRLIDAKLSEEEVPFDEENWEEAEQLIDNSRKKEKRRRWAIIFLIGLGAGIAITLPFVIMEMNKKDIKANDKVNVQSTIESKNVKAKDIVATDNKVESKAANNAPASQELVKKVDNTSTHKVASANTDVKANQSAVVSVNEIKTKVQSGKNASVVSVNKSVVNKRRDSASVTSDISMEVTNRNAQKKKAAENTTTTGQQNSETTSATLVNSVKSKKDENAVEHKAVGDTSSVVSSENKNVVSATDKKQVVSDDKAQAKVDTANKPIVVAKANKQDSVTKKTDTTKGNISANVPERLPIKETPAKKNIVSVEAGTSYSLGWNYGSNTEGSGFNPIAGVGYTHIFNAKWAAHISADYNNIGHLTSSAYTASHIDNGFAYNATDTSISTKLLHYITVPVELQYSLNEKSYVGVGGTISYLITSSGTMTTYNQTDNAIINQKVVSQTGYYKGFNQWNASVMALYGRKLSDRFSIIGEAYFGLLDIKDDSFFGVQEFERDSGVRILVSYDIF